MQYFDESHRELGRAALASGVERGEGDSQTRNWSATFSNLARCGRRRKREKSPDARLPPWPSGAHRSARTDLTRRGFGSSLRRCLTVSLAPPWSRGIRRDRDSRDGGRRAGQEERRHLPARQQRHQMRRRRFLPVPAVLRRGARVPQGPWRVTTSIECESRRLTPCVCVFPSAGCC